MVIPFLTVYLTVELHFTKIEAGIVMSTFGAGSMIGSVLGGWLTDKISSFRVQFVSLLLTVPIFVLIPHFTTLTGVCSIIFLLSFIAESFRPANSAAVSSYAKPENLTRAFSLNRMAINLGFSFGPALGGFLAAYSYLWLFYGNAFGALMTAIVFFLYFRNRKTRNKISKAESPIQVEGMGKSPYKDKYFLLFSLFCVLFSVVFSQLISIFPMYYEEVGNLNQMEVGLILGYSGIFIVVFEMLIVHYAEKHFKIYNTIILGTIFGGLTYFVLIFDQSVFMLYVSITLLCIAEILVLPFISTIAANRAGERYKGAYMGVNALSFSVALIFTPFLATNIATKYGFSTLWIFNSIISLVAIIGFRWISKKMPMDFTTA